MTEISIVTPSFNQVQYLQRTIESVLRQRADLEYIIMDGGSTDGSIEILNQYRSKAKIVVKNDNGQADAISKGFEMASGEILGWLNSDDMYLPGALARVVAAFEKGANFAYGHVCIIDSNDDLLRRRISIPVDFDDLYYGMYVLPQEGTFFSRWLYKESGGINPTYNYAMDYDLWLRMAMIETPTFLNEFISCFRFHRGQKSRSTGLYLEEMRRARRSLRRAPKLLHSMALFTRVALAYRRLYANLRAAGLLRTLSDMANKSVGKLP
jgi:glycosyltransferase involved in cell wall biosynthesis